MSPRDLELTDKVRKLEETIVAELDIQLKHYMITLATAHPVPGHDIDDLLQEMRIKMWEKIHQGKYDPTRTKPITYFSWVFRTTLFNLNRDRQRNCRIDAYDFSDSIDEYVSVDEPTRSSNYNEAKYLTHHDQMVFCDMCARIVDPHSNYIVYLMREYDPTLMCEICIAEKAHERLHKIEEYT